MKTKRLENARIYSNLGLAMLKDIRSRCAEADGWPEFQGRSAADTLEDRVLVKMGIYERCVLEGGLSFPFKANGMLDRHAVLAAIRHIHKGVRKLPRVAAEFERLSKEHQAEPRLRHDPEQQIDRDIDRYEALIAERGYGPPRQHRKKHKVCKRGAAREMGCDPRSIDRIARRRLNEIAALHRPGHVEDAGKFGGDEGEDARPNPALKPLLLEGLKRFTKGLPADPLQPSMVDIITVAQVSGIGVSDILTSAELLTIIEKARGDRPLVAHPLIAARRYTFGELIAWARDPRRLHEGPDEADREDDPENADGADGAGRDARPDPKAPRLASRKEVHALREYIRQFAGPKGEQELVPYDLNAKLVRTVRNRWQDFSPGWRGLVANWGEWNDAFRATKPLPDTLALTLRILCREAVASLQDLRRACPNSRYWAEGRAVPLVSSAADLQSVAEFLRVPLSLLKGRIDERFQKRKFDIDRDSFPNASRHLPVDFETLDDEDEQLELLKKNHWRYVRQGSPFGRRHAFMKADKYGLTPDLWTPAMVDAWEKTKPQVVEAASPLRPMDAGPRKRDESGKAIKPERVWREGTSDFKQRLLVYLFGYWHRPRDVEDLEPMATVEDRQPSLASNLADDADADDGGAPAFVREGGLGIPLELITPALLALPKLTRAYSWWKLRRSGQSVRTIPLTYGVVVRMLRPGTGVVWNSPKMLDDLEMFAAWWNENPHETVDALITIDIEPFRRDWHAAVQAAYECVKEDLQWALESDIKPTRDAFLTVGTFLDDETTLPMVKYMVGVRTLLAARPHAIMDQHVHTRDCIQTLILVQTGLRAYNMAFTFDDGTGMPKKRRRGRNGKILAPTLFWTKKDGKKLWIIRIPSSEFKNWYSPYFKGERPYQHVLRDEDGLYQLLEKYVTQARPYMLKGRKSDSFFVSSAGNDMTETSLSDRYKNITGMHFISNPAVHAGGVEGAMRHGMHAARHVIATHIVKKTGDLHLAAWAIQDTIHTVEEHYAKFIPADKVKHADRVLAEARAVGRLETKRELEYDDFLEAA